MKNYIIIGLIIVFCFVIGMFGDKKIKKSDKKTDDSNNKTDNNEHIKQDDETQIVKKEETSVEQNNIAQQVQNTPKVSNNIFSADSFENIESNIQNNNKTIKSSDGVKANFDTKNIIDEEINNLF